MHLPVSSRDACILITMVLTTAHAVPCRGPQCLEDMLIHQDQADNVLYKIMFFLRTVFTNPDNDRLSRDIVHRLYRAPPPAPTQKDLMPEKKGRPYSRFLRIGRSSGQHYSLGAEKRNYIRIGKIPSSAFMRLRGSARQDAVVDTLRRLNTNTPIRVG